MLHTALSKSYKKTRCSEGIDGVQKRFCYIIPQLGAFDDDRSNPVDSTTQGSVTSLIVIAVGPGSVDRSRLLVTDADRINHHQKSRKARSGRGNRNKSWPLYLALAG